MQLARLAHTCCSLNVESGDAIVRVCKVIAIMVVFIAGFGSNAAALTIVDAGVVGAYHGDLGGSNLANEQVVAQFLLDMVAGTSDSNGPAAGGSACNITTYPGCYATSNVEYAGTLVGAVQGADNDFTVDAGWEFALAKYGGYKGGYVLYALDGAATSLPTKSNTLWGKAGTDQYFLSHYAVFNASTTFQVPDGGTTLILLGAALGGLGLVRRRFNVYW